MNPKKIFLMDPGFIALTEDFSENRGRILEKRRGHRIVPPAADVSLLQEPPGVRLHRSGCGGSEFASHPGLLDSDDGQQGEGTAGLAGGDGEALPPPRPDSNV